MLKTSANAILLCSTLTLSVKADTITITCPKLDKIKHDTLTFTPEVDSFKQATITYPGGSVTCYYGSAISTKGNTQHTTTLPGHYRPSECYFKTTKSHASCEGGREDCAIICESSREAPSKGSR